MLMTRFKTLPLLALALLPMAGCLSSHSAPAPAAPAPAVAPAVNTFERIAIIGASSSAGFNLQLETGVPTRLADYINEALHVPHEVVFDGATELLFLDPEGMGAKMASDALEATPTVLIAPDFLFWFFYGAGPTTEARRARLETGLALLEPFTCKLVIGDLPYMQGAAGGMIPLSSMPRGDSFEAANARIYAWAAAHPNVAVTPFVAVNKTLQSGARYVLGDFTWDQDELGGLLQADQLHPNLAGTAILCLEVLYSLTQLDKTALIDVSMVDPEELVDAVDDLVSSR